MTTETIYTDLMINLGRKEKTWTLAIYEVPEDKIEDVSECLAEGIYDEVFLQHHSMERQFERAGLTKIAYVQAGNPEDCSSDEEDAGIDYSVIAHLTV